MFNITNPCILDTIITTTITDGETAAFLSRKLNVGSSWTASTTGVVNFMTLTFANCRHQVTLNSGNSQKDCSHVAKPSISSV